jgi:hypothetical protein
MITTFTRVPEGVPDSYGVYEGARVVPAVHPAMLRVEAGISEVDAVPGVLASHW